MKILGMTALIMYILSLAEGCGPVVTVNNQTQIPVRAFVRNAGRSEALSPSPGESSSAEVEEGAYTVTVMPDAGWIEYAKNVRAYLNQQLASPDNLSGPQLLEVVRRLKEIAARMQQFEQAADKGASCSGRVSMDGKDTGVATITIGAGGALVVSCR